MDLPLRVPVLLSQCYSPAPDYVLEDCHGNVAARQPLGESTGNAQLSALARSYARRGPMSSMTPPILRPPILPTQSLRSSYGPPAFTRASDRHQLQLHARRRRVDINPLWLYSQQFQTYRKKQDERDDKAGQKWPQVLEDAFLDALLVIPHIGRKKYIVRQTQYGRNMLLGEYLWLAYCASLPPDVEPDTEMLRERKQVSSHIQVLKNIFKSHRCCHIFLPKEVKKAKSTNTDEVELVSLKRHPVLVALSEGRLPDERPNYEYFARILALNNQIVIRPKRCWIFVSHQDVVAQEDGSGYIPATGEKLARDQYPHIERNLEREKWPKEEQQIFKSTMLHEFTKEFSQTESSALRDLSREWKRPFPDLHQRLEAMMAANAQKDMLTMESRCDIMHMQVTLELNEKRRFPSQSELNSWVEINIEKPHLLNHRWRVDTRLVRPAELSYSSGRSSPQLSYETSAEIAIQYQHRPECDGPSAGGDSCHCISQQSRRDWVTVPFPADVWALTLSNCAEYPAHPFTGTARRRAKKTQAASKKDGDADENAKPAGDEPQPTQMDLVSQIAMMQEIYSCPPEDGHSGDAEARGSKRWTRRGMILWTFKTLHSLDKNRKLVTAESGRTTWRFLTVLDPASEYHLQNSLIGGHRSGSATPSLYGDSMHLPTAPRDALMSPSPAYQQHMDASMSENFSAAWDAAGSLGSMSTSAVQAYDVHLLSQGTASAPPAAYGMLGGYGNHGGLTTPPPTACLTSSFSHSFDANSTGADHVPGYMTAGVTAAGMVDGSHVLSDSVPSYAASSPFHVVPYSDAGSHIPGWDGGGVTGMDSHGWQTGYVTAGGGGLGWDSASHVAGMKTSGPEHHQPQHWTAMTAGECEAWASTPTATAPCGHGRAWAGAASVLSGTATTTDEDVSQEWEEMDTSTASVAASDLSRSQSRMHIPVPAQQQDSFDGGHSHGHGHGGDELPPKVSYQGKKRGRSDSLDEANRENYPALSLPRLER